MERIRHYVSLIDKAVETYSLNKSPKELYDPINYILNLGGKRIRPAMLMLANNFFGGKEEGAINAALAIEVFHNFTLVHDDIMDAAPKRRGKPTVHKKWNSDIAILSGDVMLVQSVDLLVRSDPKHIVEILSIFNKTAMQVCEGQQYDMNFESMVNISMDDYLKMIELKTAVLLGASLRIGAVLGGAKKEDADHLYEYGKNLGIAFQLMDDILDLYGASTKVGKQVGGDILSNKKTVLLLKAKELASGAIKKELEFCLTTASLDDENKVRRVRSIFDKLNVKQLAMEEMNLFYNTAISHLDSMGAPSKNKQVFETFARTLMHRES